MLSLKQVDQYKLFYYFFQNASLKDELAEKEKRLKQLESRLTLSIQEKARSEEKLELLLEELQNIDLTSSSRMLANLEKPQTSSPSKKKVFSKSSPFSFLSSAHASGSSASTHLGFRKSSKANKPHMSKDTARETVTNINGHTNGNAHAVQDKPSSDSSESVDIDQDDENGSKACSIM